MNPDPLPTILALKTRAEKALREPGDTLFVVGPLVWIAVCDLLLEPRWTAAQILALKKPEDQIENTIRNGHIDDVVRELKEGDNNG